MAFLDHIHICNRHDLSGFRPLQAAGQVIGYVGHDLADMLIGRGDVVTAAGAQLGLDDRLDSFETRTEAVAGLVADLAAAGHIPKLRGELYRVAAAFGDAPLFAIDRAAVPPFGIRAYGVHVNGFQRSKDGAIHMWIGRRGASQILCPGMLDNMVAGGLPIGLSPLQNVIKECGEEAGIPESLSKSARAVSEISYVMETDGTLRQDRMFCFDLELPTDFRPKNQDGEVAEFHLWPVEKVAAIIRDTLEFKFNCPLVIIDFLIRHGHIPENDADHGALVKGLRRSL
jgi:isopentenyldiphosphate isomerase